MTDIFSGYKDEGIGWGRHITAAVVACFVSAVIHIVIIYFFYDSRFNAYIPTPVSVVEEWAGEPLNIKLLSIAEAEVVPGVRRGSIADIPMTGTTLRDLPPFQVDESVIAPPDGEALDSAADGIAGPMPARETSQWTPRSEILSIEKKIVEDDVALVPRKYIPVIERNAEAPDIVDVVDSAKAGGDLFGDPSGGAAARMPDVAVIEKSAVSVARTTLPLESGKNVFPSDETVMFEETSGEITAMKPLDKYLVVKTTVYRSFRDFKYGYFKIEVQSAGLEVLPVLQKDLVFVQDCSASITDQRLYFCKEGLIKCLDHISGNDRFNIISFSDRSKFCFPDWVSVSEQSIAQAGEFVRNMKSDGNTDIFSSIKALLAMKRDTARPIVAILITDGQANTGITRSSNIIGEFSKLNNGVISVFTAGTIATANNYLLDFLGYSNMGTTYSLSGGRWGIPDVLTKMMNEVSRPVLTGVKFLFASESGMEVYPAPVGNLYLDRPMVLYGRYPKGLENIVFQAVGSSGEMYCDMIFDISIEKDAFSGGSDLKKDWARHRIYHLIGEYTRNPDIDILKEIKAISRGYGVNIPYGGKF